MHDLYDLHARLIGFLRTAVQRLRALKVHTLLIANYCHSILDPTHIPVSSPHHAPHTPRLCLLVGDPLRLVPALLYVSAT